MNWFWPAAAAIVGIIAGYFFGRDAAVAAMQPSVQELHRNLASDRNLALRILRRELANWMFRRDPDRYLKTYRTAHEATKAIGTLQPGERRGTLAKLTDRHK